MLARYSLTEIKQMVKEELSSHRYQHTLAVMEQADQLAAHYGADREAAKLAGLLHDCTKEWPLSKQLKTIRQSATIEQEEQARILSSSPHLYHAVTGMLVAQERFGIHHPEVLSSIRYHTTAREEMSLLEKIIYTADKTSSDRRYPEAKAYRKLSFQSLDQCLSYLLRDVIRVLTERGVPLSQETIEAHRAYPPPT